MVNNEHTLAIRLSCEVFSFALWYRERRGTGFDIVMTHFENSGDRLSFSEEIGNTVSPRAPNDLEILLINAVSNPMVAHVDGF